MTNENEIFEKVLRGNEKDNTKESDDYPPDYVGLRDYESGLGKDVEPPPNTFYGKIKNLYRNVIGTPREPPKDISVDDRTNKYWHAKRVNDGIKEMAKKAEKEAAKRRRAEKASGLEREVKRTKKNYRLIAYERLENPAYKPTAKSYAALSTLGFVLAVSGLATGLLPLAYAGAALGFGSLGYCVGHYKRAEAVDRWYNEVEGLEDKVLEPYEDKKLYQNKYTSTDLKKFREESAYEIQHIEAPRKLKFEPPASPFALFGILASGFPVMAGLASFAKGTPEQIAQMLPWFYAGAPVLATSIGHMIGYVRGKKRARPEYLEVKGLEEKLKDLPPRGKPKNLPTV